MSTTWIRYSKVQVSDSSNYFTYGCVRACVYVHDHHHTKQKTNANKSKQMRYSAFDSHAICYGSCANNTLEHASNCVSSRQTSAFFSRPTFKFCNELGVELSFWQWKMCQQIAIRVSDAFCSHFWACGIPEQCTRFHRVRVAPLFAHTFHSEFLEFIPFILERVYLCRWHRWQRCGYPIESSIDNTALNGRIDRHTWTHVSNIRTYGMRLQVMLFVCHCAALMPAATHQ